MRIEQLSKRIADAPRGVVLALVALSVLISPGYVRQSPSAGTALAPARDRGRLAPRNVAVLELTCRSGVFSAACLRFVARVSDALELHGSVAGPVRSLVRERVVRAAGEALRLEPLLPRPLEMETGLRALAASVRADGARMRRFVAPDERATFVYADLEPGTSARESAALVSSIRVRFERSPDLAVTARGVGPEEPSSRGGLGLAALGLALAAFALAPGSWRAAALASFGALAFAVFGHGLLGLLGARDRALGGFAPELLAASAFAAAFALIARARAEQRLGRELRSSVAAALAAIGPALAVVALLSACGLAALFAIAPTALDPRRLGAAAGMAAGLVAYPLGLALTGLLVWARVLTSSPAELSGWLGKRLERALARPRFAAVAGAAVLALTAGALALLRVDPDTARVRTIVLDAGAPGAALEPAFLERVQAFQRELERRPGVVWSSSLVDAVVAPATRALHDGDPVFATVPPTRQDVARALQPWQRSDRAGVSLQLDTERRRIAVELLIAPGRASPAGDPSARPLASALLALVFVAAIGGALLRSTRGGLLCALPAAVTSGVVLGLSRVFAERVGDAGAALAPLAAGVAAALGMQLLVRTRALLAERAQLEVAQSLALRETGPALASAALASSALVALIGAVADADPAGVVLACSAPALAAASALGLLPPLVRAVRGGFFTSRAVLHSGVSQTRG